MIGLCLGRRMVVSRPRESALRRGLSRGSIELSQDRLDSLYKSSVCSPRVVPRPPRGRAEAVRVEKNVSCHCHGFCQRGWVAAFVATVFEHWSVWPIFDRSDRWGWGMAAARRARACRTSRGAHREVLQRYGQQVLPGAISAPPLRVRPPFHASFIVVFAR